MLNKTNKLINPVLPGYNPDPMLMRHGDTFYMATSTFCSFPGVAIYSSKNLINWKLVDTPLNTDDVLDMKGLVPGGGIFAPDLTYANGKFYLISVNVENRENGKGEGPFAYVTYANEIGGEWTKPILITRKGIDQSFFHDDNGKSYVVTVEWNRPNTIDVCLQEWDNINNKLMGPSRILWSSLQGNWTEAPHVFKAKGWYFLTVAEGGTGLLHQNTILRSRDLFGKYEDSPYGALITSRYDSLLEIQKAGHASVVIDGENVWVSHLGTRPYNKKLWGGSPLGRESFVQRYKWTKDEWFVNIDGGNKPRVEVEVPYKGIEQMLPLGKYDFTKLDKLPIEFLSSREAITSKWFNLTSKGAKIRGRKDMISLDTQSTINFRWLSSRFRTSVIAIDNKEDGIEYRMNHRYDTWTQTNFFVKNEKNKRTINLEVIEKKVTTLKETIDISIDNEIEFISIVKDGKMKFGFSIDGSNIVFMENKIPIDVLFETNGVSMFSGTLFGIYAVDPKMESEITFKLMNIKYFDKWSVNKD